MELFKRIRIVIVMATVVSLVLLGLAACGADEPETIAPETPESSEPAQPDADDGAETPDTDADRALVESKCSGCHTLDRVWAASQDAGQWESTVRRMEANGLQITDEERSSIVTYLAGQ